MKLPLCFHGVFQLAALLLGVAGYGVAACAADTKDSAEGIAFFESKIRPILVAHCYECHSVQTGKSEGGLELDSRPAIRKGGDRGQTVVPHDTKSSLILTAILHEDNDLKMPPKRPRLPEAVLSNFKRWIEMGAPDPRMELPTTGGATARSQAKEAWVKAGREFWSLQPPRNSKVPSIQDPSWPRQELDHFILAKLEQQGLAPSIDAEPNSLLRRLRFDLSGLPPSIENLARFQDRVNADGLDAAMAAEVDELLASTEYGERWGRHWLDVARFAESSGTEANISFPYAWRYRDYVIDSVSNDIPFDRFLLEQLAGDLLPYDNDVERARLLIATGFLAVGPKNLDSVDPLQFRADIIDEQIDTVSRALIASSIACARCHDHKFDPFSMTDYYALAGIFASTNTFFGTAVSPSNRIGGDPLVLPKNAGQKVLHASLPAKRMEELKTQLAKLREEKADMDEALKLILSGQKPSKSYTLQDALRVFWQTGVVEGELEKVSETGEALALTMGVLESGEIMDAPLLERGDIHKPQNGITRAFPEVLTLAEDQTIPRDQSGRLQLAKWLTHPSHPLTARVIVNRVWSHMFGTGIVATVDNFGATGERPSHSELLDNLAAQFMQNGWSMKKLVREIALSRTYRQSSAYRETAFHRDPDNRLLWRVSPRRLEAECIRDAILTASGELDLARPVGSLVGRVIGDRPISLIGLDKRLPADLDGALHRSVYLPVIRDRLPEVLDQFDFAEPTLVMGKRETTNVPLQSLYLMNSTFVLERAAGFATRLIQSESTNEGRIRMAFLLCFSRHPSSFELERSLDYLNRKQLASNEPIASVPLELLSFCQALFCTAEFRNLD